MEAAVAGQTERDFMRSWGWQAVLTGGIVVALSWGAWAQTAPRSTAHWLPAAEYQAPPRTAGSTARTTTVDVAPRRQPTPAEFGHSTFGETGSAAQQNAETTRRKITRPSAGVADLSDENPSAGNYRHSLQSTVMALLLVVGVIFGLAYFLKRHGPLGTRPLPQEAVQLLGKRPLDAKQSVYLVRCGSRIVLLGSAGQNLTPLAEFTDPIEVDHLAGLCLRQATEKQVAQNFWGLIQRKTDAVSQSGTASAEQNPPRFPPVDRLSTLEHPSSETEEWDSAGS